MDAAMAGRLFDALILLGGMILFSMFVEWFVGNYILPRIRLGPLPLISGAVVGVALLVYGLIQRDTLATTQPEKLEQAENFIGLVVGAIVIVVAVLAYGVGYLSRKIGPLLLGIMVAAFFGSGVVSFLLLRPLLSGDVLTDDDLFFLSVVLALIIAGLVGLVLRPLLEAPQFKPVELKHNPLTDPLSFGEKRRQRLNKKRSRR